MMIQPTRSNKSSGLMRKLNKLKTKPKHFIVDSSGFKLAHRSWKKSLKLGSFLWVVACFAIAALYFCVIVSDRYVSRAELVVKQADQIKMLPDALSMLFAGRCAACCALSECRCDMCNERVNAGKWNQREAEQG